MAMNVNEVRASVREYVVDRMEDFLKENDAIQFDDASWAIPVGVDGMTVYAEVSVKTKAWKDTKTSPAFNPETAIAKWDAAKFEKEQKAAEKAAEKAAKKKA
jgi:hypothetical protein